MISIDDLDIAISSQIDQGERLFLCGLCSQTFDHPKLLHECGHSFCLKCLESLVAAESVTEGSHAIQCPECQKLSKLATGNLDFDLKTNIAIQRALDGFRLFQANKSRSKKLEECTHRFLLKLVACPHCQEEFCDGCIFKHMECLKLEVRWAAAQVEHYAENVLKVERLSSRKRRASRNGEDPLLMEEEDSYDEEAFAAVQSMLDQVRERMVQIAKVSLLYWKIEDMAETHKVLIDHERKIFAIAKAFQDPSANMRELDKHYASVSPLTNRLHDFTLANDLCGLSELFKIPGLPKPCCRYMVEHCDKQDGHLTIAHQAAGRGFVDILRFITMEQKADVAFKVGRLGLAPIHYASLQGQQKTVEFYLKLKPELLELETDAWKTSPLCMATLAHHVDLVKYLVENFNAIIQKSTEDIDPMRAAVQQGFVDIVQYFLAKGANIRPANSSLIHLAARHNRVKVAKYLLISDPSLADDEDQFGNKLIHSASIHSPELLACMISDFKSDFTIANKSGLKPLHCACQSGNWETAVFLFEQGANVEETTDNEARDFPIHLAVKNNRYDFLKKFLQKYPSQINLTTAQGETPIQLAVKANFGKVVEILANFPMLS